EGRKQADYTKVQDVRVNVSTLVARILNYGDIIVETAGRLPNIEMTSIPSPFAVQDLIFTRMNALKERDLARAANRQRLENRRLIAGTMNQILVAVPDVRRLTLLDAGEALRQVGLKLVVDSERPARGVPPGSVVTQMPGPKVTALRDSEVYVVLSGRG
ncbi:MAG TPA: PASTA domain-containing protein, partial [Ktedonobacterales bacterium]